MKIGIIRERKTPPDTRVPLAPKQCKKILKDFDFELLVEPSPIRCFTDEDYEQAGIPLGYDMQGCDVLMGVKEVPVEALIPGKTYFFFSHTIKEQPYNRKLLQAVLEKKITLIDYEVITDEWGRRLIAFGRFAGMVGAHNGVLMYGRRTGTFEMPRMKDFYNYAEAQTYYEEQLKLPPVRIVLTGTGRVGQGAAQVLRDMGIRQVSPNDFLVKSYKEPVFALLMSDDYAARKDGSAFDKDDFHLTPELFESTFKPFTKVCDLMINGVYWDNKAPAFFTLEDMRSPDFSIQAVADVTCDIAPVSSIPSTIRASTIADPIFGFDPVKEQEVEPHSPNAVDMMTIDNLPSELPRDASEAFGQMFIERVLPELLDPKSEVIERATIARDGKLAGHFSYLENYVKGGKREADKLPSKSS